MTHTRRMLLGLATGLCLSMNAPVLGQESMTPQAQADLAFARSLSSAFKHAAERIEHSVVHITSARLVQPVRRDIFGRALSAGEPSLQRAGLGSGVIADERGYILTNNHVIENADQFLVRLSDGREYPAELIGADPPTDLAVLRIETEGVTPARFGDSEALEVGEWVLAAGSPFGFANSITAGIVSAKGRTIEGSDERTEIFQEFIQTDAAINPGNSGGPLIDLTGAVVGINTAIASRTGSNAGLGFAIPADIAQRVMTQIIDAGRVNRGWLGVEIQELEPEVAVSLGIEGGIVLGPVVEGSPADNAGLREGDIITAFAGRATTSPARLRNAIALTGPNTRAMVEFVRNGRHRRAEVTVIDRDTGARLTLLSLGARTIDRLGLTVIPNQLEIRRGGRTVPGPAGLAVIEIDPEGLGASAGFQAGDLITGVEGNSVSTPEELDRAVRIADLSRGVRLNLVRTNARGGVMRGYIDIIE